MEGWEVRGTVGRNRKEEWRKDEMDGREERRKKNAKERRKTEGTVRREGRKEKRDG